MSRECERVGGINLGQGICDLPTIRSSSKARATRSTREGDVLEVRGIDPLREKIAAKCERFNGFTADPRRRSS
jgi:aminotransferase